MCSHHGQDSVASIGASGEGNMEIDRTPNLCPVTTSIISDPTLWSREDITLVGLDINRLPGRYGRAFDGPTWDQGKAIQSDGPEQKTQQLDGELETLYDASLTYSSARTLSPSSRTLDASPSPASGLS